MAGPVLRILGVDPGCASPGSGSSKRRHRIAYIASGCIRSGNADLPERQALEGLDDVQDVYTTAVIRLRGDQTVRAIGFVGIELGAAAA